MHENACIREVVTSIPTLLMTREFDLRWSTILDEKVKYAIAKKPSPSDYD